MIPLMKNAFLNEGETKAALAEFVMRTSKFSMDVECRAFERKFAEFQKRTDAVLFNSGGSANLAMLQSLKNLGRLKTGDKVGFSALTWSTNTMPIIQLGLVPVAVDINRNTLNVMSENLGATLSSHELKAFFVTNVLGFAGDLMSVQKLCNERGVIMIEDNCESLGTRVNGDLTGNFGEMASFSFFVAHHMSTIEGGMVVTDDEPLSEMLRITRANGWDRNLTTDQQVKWRSAHAVASEMEAKYCFYDLGFNFRPTEITGFLGNLQIQYLAQNIATRSTNYHRLAEITRMNEDLQSVDTSHLEFVSNFAYPVVCRSRELRERYASRCHAAGVEIRPMIAGNIQNQPFYKKYVRGDETLPDTDFVDQNGFYFGNYPELTEADLQTLEGCLRKG
jgi:CDP-6-deoxy-D-xylo-4-hexulose-3-dehydrase